MTPVAKAHIQLLEVLDKSGKMEDYLSDRIPDNVMAAAMHVISDKFRLPYDKAKGRIVCTREEQEEAEWAMYHYLLSKGHIKAESGLEIVPTLPREIVKGAVYVMKYGSLEGKALKVKGTDKEIYGIDWLSNFDNKVCQTFPFRAQRDDLWKIPKFMWGPFYVAANELGKEYIVHKAEIGEMVH